jgi:hypothetical protein
MLSERNMSACAAPLKASDPTSASGPKADTAAPICDRAVLGFDPASVGSAKARGAVPTKAIAGNSNVPLSTAQDRRRSVFYTLAVADRGGNANQLSERSGA